MSNNHKPSFATMASSFLSRAQQPMSSSTASTSQPMFFSFTTDDSEGNIGRSQYPLHADGSEDGDIHLAGESGSRDTDDDNPYLRLDEVDDDDPTSVRKGKARESVRLMMDESSASRRSEAQGGWLAHGMMSPSPSSSSSSPRTSSDDRTPPSDILVSPTHNKVPPPPRLSHSSYPQQHQQRIGLDSSQLTESLLPSHPSGSKKDTFNLPDPSLYPTRSRRKYHDSFWMSAFLFAMSFVYVAAFLMLIFVKKPKNPPEGTKGGWHSPYSTLLRTVPLLTILTFATACGAYLHVFLLSKFVGIVMWTTELLTPVLLLLSALWAFTGSFIYDEGEQSTWGETIGLRLFSMIPFFMAIYTARTLFEVSFIQDTTSFTTTTSPRRRRSRHANIPPSGTRKFSPQIKLSLPSRIRKASKTLKLTMEIMMDNPFLMLLSPVLLLGVVGIGSLPFGVVGVRLLLIGSFEQEGGTWGFHLKPYIPPLLVLTTVVWLWGVMTARGILRVVTGGVVGSWVYTDPAFQRPPPFSSPSLLQSRATLYSALFRSTQPSFGTICFAALLLSLARILSSTALIIQRLPIWSRGILGWMGGAAPGLAQARIVILFGGVLAWVGAIVGGWCERKAGILSNFALIHTGLTGSSFWLAVSRARALTSSSHSLRPHLPLSLTPLLLPLPNALGTYLFVAHTLKSPQEAFASALLAAVATLVVGGWVVGGVLDVAETLYLCYCIDVDMGVITREDIWDAFKHDEASAPPRQSQPEPVGDGDDDEDREFDQPILPSYHHNKGQKKTHPLPVPLPTSIEEDMDEMDINTPRAHPVLSNSNNTVNTKQKKEERKEASEGSDIDPFNVGASHLDDPASTSYNQGAQSGRKDGEGEGEDSDVFPGSGFF